MPPTAVIPSRKSPPAPARPRTTRAAILVQQHRPLVLAEVELPVLAPGQVLVRVAYSGICGKQLDELVGRRGPDPHLPHLLGHEGAGTVVDVGPGVRKVRPGERVVLHWMKGSGIDAATPALTWDGKRLNAGWVTTFSEHTIASENRLTPLPATVGLEVAWLLGCAVTTGLGIVFNDARLAPGESIAVFGAGGVGLNVMQGSALVSAGPIVAVDLHEGKLAHASRFGAHHTLLATRHDLETALLELSGGKGFDVTVDTTGVAAAIQTAYRVTHPAGRTVIAGVLDSQTPITIDSYPLHFGRRLIGSHGGETKPDTDIPRYLRLYQRGVLKLDELITHRYRLAQVNEALETVRRGEAIRCVLDMTGEARHG